MKGRIGQRNPTTWEVTYEVLRDALGWPHSPSGLGRDMLQGGLGQEGRTCLTFPLNPPVNLG